MSKRILITGASGFIGYHLIKAAQKAGFEVDAAVRSSSRLSHLNALAPNFVTLDFGSEESLKRSLEEGQYAYIIHAAGATKAKNLEEYNLVNAEYTRNLAQATEKADIPLEKFVFVSSLAAIGPSDYHDVKLFTENRKPNPVTAYGKSKLLAEEYLSDSTLPLAVLRPTAVYGPGEKDLYIVFKMLQDGLDLYIGKKPQRFSFVYVQDLVNAIMLSMQAENKAERTYNISDGNVYGRYELADTFKDLLSKKTIRVHIPEGIVKIAANVLELAYMNSEKSPVLNKEKLNELTAPNWACSIEAAKKDLHYRPAYNLKTGLAESMQWYTKGKWL
ncbi:NAD-dependent epimerase/dehydratase family protein [Dyadobacter subterraneus]|uniref:NAD-dependent epimerase/dehydratase family protein n=1 Tax=Dyadobacter subterraneus TaxID=2773304 RepID=A0ABR9WF94_9BACT|nr:NAD-dependent epimerase/dehydratase family protein [Dyadobacter subterraneus]MBE9464172.1 NAD-dependent epimerase/dehydratase family protein [Dyadobacter subterraneus]